MQGHLTAMLVHMSHSHQQLARILTAKRHVTVRMSHLVQALPDENPRLNGIEGLLDSSSQVTKSIVAYLNSLADLEEAVADSLTHVLKATGVPADEE